MLTRLNDDICQVGGREDASLRFPTFLILFRAKKIRLELDNFDLAAPNSAGECETDFFLVTGGTAVPQLCGLNSGQHREFGNLHNFPNEFEKYFGSFCSDLLHHVQQRPHHAVGGDGHHRGRVGRQDLEHQDLPVRVLQQEPG